MRHEIEFTLKVKGAEVAPGTVILTEITVTPAMPYRYLCDLAMLIASELELRRVQRTNDPTSRPEIPLDGASRLILPP